MYKKLILSLTSYPTRIKYVKQVLESIISQNVSRDLYHIVLVLAESEFPNKISDLSKELNSFIHDNDIEIIWYHHNILSHKKLIPTLLKYPDNPILVLDDDIIRPKEWLKTFIEDHKRYPHDIICGTVYQTFNKKLELLSLTTLTGYNKHPFQLFYHSKHCSGLSGTLFPAHTFTDKRFFDEKLMMEICPTSDETWQYCFLIIENKVIRHSSMIFNYCKYMIKDAQETALMNNNKHKYNDINKKLFEVFPEFKEKLLNRVNKYKW